MKAYIIDISAFMHRGYFGFKDLKSSDGTPTGAIYFFMLKMIEIIKTFGKPDILIAAYDSKSKDLERKVIYPEYKSGRPEKPDDLKIQFKIIQNLTKELGFINVEVPGQEADDIIGTYSRFFEAKKIESLIFTTDKDMAQLCDNDLIKVAIVNLAKNSKEEKFRIIDKNEVVNFLGVEAQLIPDLFGLIGDKADAIPGVCGIGEKNGIKLISEYRILEQIYANIDNFTGKLKENLIRDRDNAYISRQLATINCSLSIAESIEQLLWKGFHYENVNQVLGQLSMNKTMKDFTNMFETLMDNPTNTFYDIMIKDENNLIVCNIIHTGREWETCIYGLKWGLHDVYTDTEYLSKAKYSSCSKTKTNNILGAINLLLQDMGYTTKLYSMPYCYKNLTLENMKNEIIRTGANILINKTGE